MMGRKSLMEEVCCDGVTLVVVVVAAAAAAASEGIKSKKEHVQLIFP
jgi:hypothetical protein